MGWHIFRLLPVFLSCSVYVCMMGCLYMCVCMHACMMYMCLCICGCMYARILLMLFFDPGTHIYYTGVPLLKHTHPAPSLEWVKLLSCKIYIKKILNDKHQPLFCHHVGKYNSFIKWETFMGFRNNNFNYSVENVSVQFSIPLNCNIKSLKVHFANTEKQCLYMGVEQRPLRTSTS